MAKYCRKPAAARPLGVRLRANRRMLSWLGAALALAGAATVVFPKASTLVVGTVSGWLLWFAGAVLIAACVLVGATGAVRAGVVVGLVAIVAGAFLLFFPMIGALAATILIAAVLIVDGALELALALRLRPLSAWRWVLTSALASVAASVVAVVLQAGRSETLVATLVGVAFACSGLALMTLGRALGAGGHRIGLNQAIVGGGH